MFLYFGYGSNINLLSLKAKGVIPLASEWAILRGWRLRFNVRHWFNHEGGVANIEKSDHPGDFVEGMVHTCNDEDLHSLDAMESYGLGYTRIVIEAETNHGPVKAQAYIGLPDFLDETCLPSRRYLSIIRKGAEAAGLSLPYLAFLRSQPIQAEIDYPEFISPPGNWPEFGEKTLLNYPGYTALGGSVFDMQYAREKLKGIIGLLGGKDMTLFYLKRLDSSTGKETTEDIKNGRISPEGKKYLNAYLNEYAREYRYVGRYIYTER